MNKTIYTAVALLLLGISSIVPWADAQQKPAPVIIWCQDSSGNFAPCLGGNTIDYDTGGGTVNQGTVGIVLPASGGPVAGGTATNPIRIDPAGTTPQPASQSGTWTVQPGNTANTTAWLFKLDQTSTNNDVDIASALPAGSNTIGNVNPGTATNWGVYVEDAAETAGGNLSMMGSVRRDTTASSAGSSGDNATINTDANGLLWTRTIDPCSSAAKTFLPINISTATTTEITPSLAGASTNYYVCSLVLVSAAANNVALIS